MRDISGPELDTKVNNTRATTSGISGNLEMSGNSAEVREKAQSQERPGNLCSQRYLKGIAHTDAMGLVTTAVTGTAIDKSSVTTVSVAVKGTLRRRSSHMFFVLV